MLTQLTPPTDHRISFIGVIKPNCYQKIVSDKRLSQGSNHVHSQYVFLNTGMSKATTIKEALAKYQAQHDCKAEESEKVMMFGQLPPIEKMDASLSTLTNCVQLSLSTNAIEKIANLNGLKHLKILSLGRNNIKSLTGLEAVGDTLEQLWISYNNIEKLKGINVLKKLKVLYMANNAVKDMGEFQKLADLPCLEELVFVGNPLEEKLTAEGTYRTEVANRLPKLKKLDGVPVIREEQEDED